MRLGVVSKRQKGRMESAWNIDSKFCSPEDDKNTISMSSSLTLKDIIDAVSSWGKIRLIQRDNKHSWHHRIYIEFRDMINCNAIQNEGLTANSIIFGGIDNTPFAVSCIDGQCCMGSKMMCVSLLYGATLDLRPKVYRALVRYYNPSIEKYYDLVVCMHGDSFYRLIEDCESSGFDRAQVRREVLIAWLRYSGDAIKRRGIHLDDRYAKPFIEPTKDEVIQFNSTLWTTRYEI